MQRAQQHPQCSVERPHDEQHRVEHQFSRACQLHLHLHSIFPLCWSQESLTHAHATRAAQWWIESTMVPRQVETGEEAPARTACFAPTLLRAEHSQSQEHNRNRATHAHGALAWQNMTTHPSFCRGGDRKDKPEPRHDARRIRPSSAPSEHLLQSARVKSAQLCCRRRRREQDSARSGRIGAPAATGPAQSLHPSRRRPRSKQVRGTVPVA